MSKKYDIDYLELLSQIYPDEASVSTELINLSAIINLPKGTEHFLTDVHGEHEAFSHVLRNASGVVKRKIDDTFLDTLTMDEKNSLATLIYYPHEKLQKFKDDGFLTDMYYTVLIHRLVLLCRAAGYKYTRSKVRKALPKNYAYIIEELLYEDENNDMKKGYYDSVIDSIVETGLANSFIIAICKVIRRLVIDRLHIVGDIYDRGPGAHIIMDILMNHHAVDIQWGNHDIIWMAAAAGSQVCIANVLRICLRYGNLETIEEGYGISLTPLARFTMDYYPNDYPKAFKAKVKDDDFSMDDVDLISRMQKAMAIIQFKLEGQLIERRPEFNMESRNILHTIDINNKTVEIEGVKYEINDVDFPTLRLDDPYALTDEEYEVMQKLTRSFMHAQKLQEHTKFLYEKGGMYLVHNGNLLYHGCIPLNEDGSFEELQIGDKTYRGKNMMIFFDDMARRAYFSENIEEAKYAQDIMWYAWCGPVSPLFGKHKMATFERYFINDKSTHKEIKNPYYEFRSSREICENILKEFGLTSKHSCIISGHVPVKASSGELPIKGEGKLIVIDGGFSKAYQSETGIAGYTLIFNSQGMVLVSHEPFESVEKAVEEDYDIMPKTVFIQNDRPRMYVGDTNNGKKIKKNIECLKALLEAYRNGIFGN